MKIILIVITILLGVLPVYAQDKQCITIEETVKENTEKYNVKSVVIKPEPSALFIKELNTLAKEANISEQYINAATYQIIVSNWVVYNGMIGIENFDKEGCRIDMQMIPIYVYKYLLEKMVENTKPKGTDI